MNLLYNDTMLPGCYTLAKEHTFLGKYFFFCKFTYEYYIFLDFKFLL